MEETLQGVRRFPVDAEHAGIRTAGCLTLIVSMGLSFFVLNSLLIDASIVALLGALVVGAVSTSLIDRLLRGRWQSGREVNLSDEAIVLSKQGQDELRLHPQQLINVQLWYFVVSRNGRVKKGWHVVACALEQDDALMAVYTFMSPQDFEQLHLNKRYVKLIRAKELEKQTDMRVAGIQRRLLVAEAVRGERGAEMSAEQYAMFIEQLQGMYPRWMPKD
jgi:hypothetical protein